MGGDGDNPNKMKKFYDSLIQQGTKWFDKSKKAISKLDLKKTFSKFNIKSVAGDKRFNIKVVNKKRFMINMAALSVIIVGITYFVFANNAFSVVINGVEVAKVKHKETAEEVITALKQSYEKENDVEVAFSSQISYEKVNASKKELLEGKALEEKLKGHLDYQVKCAVIYADDKPIATLKTKEEVDKVLSGVEQYYTKGVDLSKIKEKGFSEKVEVKEEFMDVSTVMNVEEAQNYIINGTTEVRIHKVEAGESFWSISRKYGISLEDLQRANPTANPEKIKIGQELNLVVPKSLINVKTVEEVTYTDKIPYEQKLEYSSSMYKDQTQVRVKGEYGEKEVKAEVVKINGIESERIILSENVTKEPKTQILVKGTKEPPPKKGTGTFITPTRGTVTSRFGYRWGRNHNGLDIAAPVGTAVKAADGGEVIFASTSGNYGKLIKIDHGGGFVTYYGHLSKISVKVGDKVYKGQTIGAVGTTGRTTGPHLHFEIRKNGNPVNPSKYL
ncbi:peptidoglycan DD-metalloendopeptidase family protein [Lutispora thermophila]|uniref:Murein DD-endopeptidase MepM and murein hydrolase activator NlpD, contain LysM domain n=1 Tax=Lutispora thermophila DSM 19022 TaxID=1122184 RepID=A0A1M6GVJ5_9FIRM|nr:peptidoglycan DD-metalloendopeptidase family protein [Lutispora thermophila]SHJ13925.1 Murein DD-endopeptidase MepM and murein hydrolase activator NlpD, contain LysM domain [Lutispora thermophila DSM 19022]